MAVRRSGTNWGLGLEWRRFSDPECEVYLPRGFHDRRVPSSCSRSPLLRHDLPGTVLWAAEGSPRGMEAELADYLRSAVERESLRDSWDGGRQCSLSGYRGFD